MSQTPYIPSRNLTGYGPNPPNPAWPGKARVALNLVLNYEEGAEYHVDLGDSHGESILSELAPFQPESGRRYLNVEQCYEYGARVGVWRIFRTVETRQVPLTVYAVGQALEFNPMVGEHIAKQGHDVVSHGWRWIDYAGMPEEVEREHIGLSVAAIEKHTGRRPLGWYTGRESLNTRRLVVEEGGFLYDSDAYNDDLPYWVDVEGQQHLVVPHSLDCNDSRFSRAQGIDLADTWFAYMRDSFDCLYAEGEHAPTLMTVSLHCRLIGRPGRISALAKFLDHVLKHDGVWLCQREDIARHWCQTHPPRAHPPMAHPQRP